MLEYLSIEKHRCLDSIAPINQDHPLLIRIMVSSTTIRLSFVEDRSERLSATRRTYWKIALAGGSTSRSVESLPSF